MSKTDRDIIRLAVDHLVENEEPAPPVAVRDLLRIALCDLNRIADALERLASPPP